VTQSINLKYPNKNKLKNLILLALLHISTFALAQAQDLETHFSALRNKQATKPFTFTKKNEVQYLKQLSIYLNDTLPSVRTEAYFLIGKLGRQSQQKNIRKEVVNILVRGWHDEDSGINGQVATTLTKFSTQDFDRTAVDSIRRLLDNLPPYKNKLFKLVGYLALQDQARIIKSHLEKQPPLSSKDRWAAYLALVRLGDQQSLDVILNQVRAYDLGDDVVYEVFPDLIYTRSYRSISYLVEILFNDEQNCEPPNGDSNTKINCAYRVMELLAPVIKDFPIAVGASGDLVERDYRKALTEVRAWFKQKDGKYEIIRDTY
jgi:hypothetical protein